MAPAGVTLSDPGGAALRGLVPEGVRESGVPVTKLQEGGGRGGAERDEADEPEGVWGEPSKIPHLPATVAKKNARAEQESGRSHARGCFNAGGDARGRTAADRSNWELR